MNENNNQNKRQRRMKGNEPNGSTQETGGYVERLPTKRTNRKYRYNALTALETSHLRNLSEDASTLLNIHTWLTWKWFMETIPWRNTIAMLTEEVARNLGFASKEIAWWHYYSKITASLANTVQLQCYIKANLYWCFHEINQLRFISISARPVPPVPPRVKRQINCLSEQEAYHWTGFTKHQLYMLLPYLRLPKEFITRSRYKYTGEETLLMCLTYIRTGHDWVVLAEAKYFGGDARRCSEMFDWFIAFLFHEFYNAITGHSMDIWVPYLEEFRKGIWHSFTERLLSKDGNEVQFQVDLRDWRIAFFIDCTCQATCRPGGGANFVDADYNEYVNQVQRAFYTGYTKQHGLKFQVLWAPNGMFLSIFGSSMRENDNGMVNISGLNHYLERIMPFVDTERQYQVAAYGDAIYNERSCIVGRAKKTVEDPWRKIIDKQLGRKRASIENSFADFNNYAQLLSHRKKHKILKQGEKAMMTTMVAFFLFNCKSCFQGNSTSSRFNVKPPSLQEYLPLDKNFSRNDDQDNNSMEAFWNPEENVPEIDPDDF